MRERVPFAERQREEREAAMRKRRTSIRLGTAGLLLLFGGAIATVLRPESVGLLLVPMLGGLALVAVAFVVIRSATPSVLSLRGLTKIL
jgi:hypothetical protein